MSIAKAPPRTLYTKPIQLGESGAIVKYATIRSPDRPGVTLVPGLRANDQYNFELDHVAFEGEGIDLSQNVADADPEKRPGIYSFGANRVSFNKPLKGSALRGSVKLAELSHFHCVNVGAGEPLIDLDCFEAYLVLRLAWLEPNGSRTLLRVRSEKHGGRVEIHGGYFAPFNSDGTPGFIFDNVRVWSNESISGTKGSPTKWDHGAYPMQGTWLSTPDREDPLDPLAAIRAAHPGLDDPVLEAHRWRPGT